MDWTFNNVLIPFNTKPRNIHERNLIEMITEHKIHFRKKLFTRKFDQIIRFKAKTSFGGTSWNLTPCVNETWLSSPKFHSHSSFESLLPPFQNFWRSSKFRRSSKRLSSTITFTSFTKTACLCTKSSIHFTVTANRPRISRVTALRSLPQLWQFRYFLYSRNSPFLKKIFNLSVKKEIISYK